MKVKTKVDFNFHKLTEQELKNMISFLMNECADAAKARILEGFEREFDINGLGFEKNAYKYSLTKRNPRIMTESGKLKNSIDVDYASLSNRTSKVGSDVDYGEDHFEDRVLKGTFTPARLWFFTTDNLGGETPEFLKQYDDVFKNLMKASGSRYIPFFLKKITTSLRSL
jgi:phage gpG-like protein|tara:strand:- start:316 stop:822 length:507 start_codon:yes stop_codon:yes gene_type:complete